MDGGNDSFDTIKVLDNSIHFFLVKRNLRKESKAGWLDAAMRLLPSIIPIVIQPALLPSLIVTCQLTLPEYSQT